MHSRVPYWHVRTRMVVCIFLACKGPVHAHTGAIEYSYGHARYLTQPKVIKSHMGIERYLTQPKVVKPHMGIVWESMEPLYNTQVIVRRAGLLLSQQDFEWRWSVPLFQCLTVLEFSFILFDLCLLITFFNFIMNYVPIVTFWIFTYHKIWILSIMFCFIWSYWIIYFLACL